MNSFLTPERDPTIWKGITAGAIGGLCAAWMMLELQELWNDHVQHQDSTPLHEHGVPEHRVEGESGTDEAAGDDATLKIVEAVLRKQLTEAEKKVVGPLMHYGFGAALGALYGGAAELVPAVRTGWGLPFGAAVFVGADEIVVPALGFSAPPNEVPITKHAYGLVTHLVFGLTTEIVRRGVRASLKRDNVFSRSSGRVLSRKAA